VGAHSYQSCSERMGSWILRLSLAAAEEPGPELRGQRVRRALRVRNEFRVLQDQLVAQVRQEMMEQTESLAQPEPQVQLDLRELLGPPERQALKEFRVAVQVPYK